MVIGITGKFCAGKNTVAAEFERKGYLQIEVDRLGHQALDIKKDEIAENFGSVVVVDGKINRPVLGGIIFRDAAKKRLLESIVHPLMVEMVKKAIEENRDGKVIINAAILEQMGLDSLCSAVIWVTAPLTKRIERAVKRDSLPLKAIIARIKVQKNLKPNIKQNNVDTYIINNTGNINKIAFDVDSVLKKIEARK